ncbi:hypothetical protein VTJ04DRAFT_6652 [Mycothermus thermophilus]|uniref:uncharacterized protein n=1 Tax=Humicola insolens TaxID=85995 RepID=UPI003743F0AD
MPSHSIPSSSTFHGRRLLIPNLQPAFSAWKQGINPLHEQVKQAVDVRLAELLLSEDSGAEVDKEREERRILETATLEKVKAADIGLFAAGLFPDAPYDILEIAAFYNVWVFLWDDAIDGGDGDLSDAEAYCRQSVAFVERSLGSSTGVDSTPSPAAAPTKVCASFGDVGKRLRELCAGREELTGELAGRLKEYMEGCVTEYRARLLGRVPSVEEFYGWRLKTSSVEVFLVLTRILNHITLPDEILALKEVSEMGLSINKLLIQINELFSFKKELKDGAFSNLIPITMCALDTDLQGAVDHIIQDIHQCIQDFDRSAAAVRARVAKKYPDSLDQFDKMVGGYQAVATTVLNFSIRSPRYGLLKYRQLDGSFVVEL